MQKSENYRKQYLETLKDRIERVFNYCEKDISVQMKISECKEKYNKKI
jgi:guanylate kinase